MIVAPERDVPGTMESTWNTPISSAVVQGDLADPAHLRPAPFVIILDDDKQDTINDQHDSYHNVIIQLFFDKVVKWNRNDHRGQAGYCDLQPHNDLIHRHVVISNC